MARPTKQGVDYFPLDVHLDNKFKFVEIKYGLKGFAIVIKMMQNIYSQSFWCMWGEDEILLFASEHQADFEELEAITDECIKRDIFDESLYEKYNILTSKGIQKRYKEIVRRRKDVEVIPEYLLIDGTFGVIDDINPSSSRQTDVKSTQSKVKESKEKESSSRNKVYDVDSLYYKMADYFYKLILKNNPQYKKPNYQKWSDDFRKLVELDKRDKDQVRKVMEWVQQDDFEMVNVLSPSKLRNRYDNLFMKMNKGKSADIVKMPKYEVEDKDGTSNGKHPEENGNVRLFR